MSKAKFVEEVDMDKVDRRIREMKAEFLGIPALAYKPSLFDGAHMPNPSRWRDSCIECGIMVEYIAYDPATEVTCKNCED